VGVPHQRYASDATGFRRWLAQELTEAQVLH
jgi:hypothetical protein